jgi:hypothetical protein
MQVREPGSESLQSTLEHDPEAGDSQMEIVHDRALYLYDLCGLDDEDEIEIETVIPL